MHRFLPVFLALGLTGPGAALAANFCVTSSAELELALGLAEMNDEDDIVRIAAGNLAVPVGGFAFGNQNGDGKGLHLSGGWSPFFDNPCGQQLPGDYQATVLDGGGAQRVLSLVLYGAGEFSLERLVLSSGSTGTGSDGAGLRVQMAAGFTGSLRIEGVQFVGNQAARLAGGLRLIANGSHGGVVLANNVFIFNGAGCRFGAAQIQQPAGALLYLLNNTIVFNGHGDSCDSGEPGTGGIDVYGFEGQEHIAIVNNLFWANADSDLQVRGAAGAAVGRLEHNNFGTALLESVAVDIGNRSLDPQLKWAGSGMFQFPTHRLEESSPMVDAGTPPPTPWTMLQANEDINGQPRVVGRAVDIGAWEEPSRLFGSGFEGDPWPL